MIYEMISEPPKPKEGDWTCPICNKEQANTCHKKYSYVLAR